MVCDGAMVINFVASAMMNGVCCMHQMQCEEERKQEYHDALRRAMTVEWQRHRLMEKELEEQRQRAQGCTSSSQEAEERRRLLMTAKQNATTAAAASTDHLGTLGVPAPTVYRGMTNDNGRLSRTHSELSHYSASSRKGDDARSTISTSSLLDNEDDDEEEEEEEFENIDL